MGFQASELEPKARAARRELPFVLNFSWKDLFDLYFVYFPESKVYSKTEISPCMVDRDKLFGVLRGKIVGPEAYVEPSCAEVEYGT